jgi:cation diffusion facilitator family transporter
MRMSDSRRQVRRVLLITLILNLAVAIGKIIIGAVSGAISITADGFHSLMDSASNLIGLIANRVAEQPPDEQHPYGHRRFETIAALGIGVLLLLTAWEIISSAIERLQTGGQPEITPLTFIVLIGTLLVNLVVSRYEQREGKRLNSELLVADAANTSADVFVTLSVLASMTLVSLGFTWADPIAALIIVALIGRAGWQVLRSTGGVLVDTAPYAPGVLRAVAESVPSVERVLRARSRGSADDVHIDIDVQVPPETTADHTAAIADAIRQTMRDKLAGVAEVEIHFAPAQNAAPDYALAARARADALGLSTHEVRVMDGPNGKVLEMHVEVPAGQTLASAHEQVSRLETDVCANLPEVAEVITHIEPALNNGVHPPGPTGQDGFIERAASLLRGNYPTVDWHHLRVSPLDDGYALTMHATLPAQTSLEDAHGLAEAAEMLVRSEMPQVRRVTIHTEPPE